MSVAGGAVGIAGAAAMAVVAVGAGRATAPAAPAVTGARLVSVSRTISDLAAESGPSAPTGLAPNQTVTPLVAPAQPVVLSWNPVSGAASYNVAISSSPAFATDVWTGSTDQTEIAPTQLLADGTYWWRVTAVNADDTPGPASTVATFSKEWTGQVTGGVVSDSPGGPAASLVSVTPYLDWNPTPGAAYYQAQIAIGDQFATPVYDSGELADPGASPGADSVLPDGSYIWRVRAIDAAGDPGPWTVESTFTKEWDAPTVTEPAQDADTSNFELAWDPVSGAASYDVQVTDDQYNFTGSSLVVDGTTDSTAYVPDLSEQGNTGITYGQYWWRVRPVIDGITGAWSPVQDFTYTAPSGGSATPTLSTSGSGTDALTPVLNWTPVTGAAVYRVDIATDAQFNNIVFSDLTTNTAWAMRTPLPDYDINGGYYWRVVWGAQADPSDPQYMVDESSVPVAQFTKQSEPTLGSAASGVVSSPPLFTWTDVPGAGEYELQVSRDEQFDSSTTQSMDVYGLGAYWAPTGGQPLTSGTWYWRVRPIDGSGQGLTYSPVQSFTISPPAATPSAPSDGATVVGSPLLNWQPVTGACSYDVQFSDTSTFPDDDGSSSPSGPGAVNTAQTAYVPTGQEISHAGTWYWRVRPEMCDTDTGAWSATQTFISERPPSFHLNTIPARVSYGGRVTIAGQLIANGSPVDDPTLILERRLYPDSTYTPVGVVKGGPTGHFAFSLEMTRSADWELRWTGSSPIDHGTAAFSVTVVPRVLFGLSSTKVVHDGRFVASGFVYPHRPAWIQIEAADGWIDLAKVSGATSRFRVTLRARLATGTHHLRLYSPMDSNHELAGVASAGRALFVYDVIVIKP